MNPHFDALLQALRILEIDHVHVHHTGGFGIFAMEWLGLLIESLGCDYDLTLHDYAPICPRLHFNLPDGSYCGEPGLGERLGFIYNSHVVERTEVTTDITYDRSKLIATIAANYDVLKEVAEPHIEVFKQYNSDLADFANGVRPDKPKKPRFKVQLPTFLSFIRAPFCVSFRIEG